MTAAHAQRRSMGRDSPGDPASDPAGGDDPVTDAELIARSAEDPEPFAALFDRYAAQIHHYAARRLGAQAADDIVAETFLIAFRRRGTYDLGRPLARPWLYGIATKLISRHRRNEERHYRALQRTGADPLPEPMADAVVTRVTAQQQERRLSGALARLSSGDRDVLLLVAWGDLGYEEVAEALAIPPGTVGSRLNRARREHGSWSAQEEMFVVIRSLMAQSAPPPKLQAALYRVLPRIKGVTLHKDAVDAAGRHGVAFAMTAHSGGDRQEIILDPATYRFLGTRAVALRSFTVPNIPRRDGNPDTRIPAGTILYLTAQLAQGIVDEPGQRP